MDTSDSEIAFDHEGVCNHCRAYERRAQNEIFDKELGEAKINRLVNEIKRNGINKEYDCIIGVSGGVDSTMVAYKVKELGLKPLAVHLDNGWDSELAVHNIEFTLNKLNIDLVTIVLDWEEFRDLQLAFLYSSVPNIEIPTDHAIPSVLFRTASEKGIKYIISGGNVVSEAIMPHSWMYDSRDLRFIKAIHTRYGTVPLKDYPSCSLSRYFYYVVVRGIKYTAILNFTNYNKKEAKALIQKELGWRDYGGKHGESIFTRFFQGYILPEKFKMDKRRAHLSALICSKQITRDEALLELQKPLYPTELFRADYELFIKKMKLTAEKFDAIMKTPVKSHHAYSSNAFIFEKNYNRITSIVKSIVKPKSLKSQ
jgi:N-acetyl sugar amidotransferase